MSDSSSSLLIDTPENLTLAAEVAGIGSRCIAAMLDYLILGIVLFVLVIAFGSSLTGVLDGESSWTLAILVLIQFLLMTFYHLFFELIWNGQTPGKRRVGIRVVKDTGMPVSSAAILIRNFLRLFDFLPLAYGFGLIAFFFSGKTQRLGDLAARTIVIYDRPQMTLDAVREDFTVKYLHISRTVPLSDHIHIERLDDDDRRHVVQYLQRRTTIKQRSYLAEMLAERFAAKLDLPSTQFANNIVASEQFLEQIARAFEIRAHQD